ncbi:NAD-dependent epimerase/dehydratase [Anaeromyxobacter sp. K]|uniref:NAD-dependent epimerase/dehydratase family protein n=1 Tax=Anaeromyxobacter sp. (strain K) TaxID=447217 RepID=UPI00015F8FA5|nr:NAD-dependent epimerase/dehydratase family protein [Anaeromyxobacter sp. K]ACG73079.1 NAD-dependent epimerase/dehydratase [Anaeromyxobacter sp. K]
MHVLVAGCGWLGSAIARRLLFEGQRVTGIRRDPARAAALASTGIAPLALDLAAPGAEARLPAVDAVVACQSATSDTTEAYRAAYLDANRALLAHARRCGARLVYTGSTGVLGQSDGLDVDESSPPMPLGPTAEVLAEAERAIQAAGAAGLGACVVRLSGLYGPGRAGIVERVRSGRLALGAGEQAWMNFCHLDDAVSFVLAAIARGAPGAVYHGSDAAPARRREVVRWIADRIGVEPARATVAPPGPDRRVLSERTRAALGVTLACPSFREGLIPLVPEVRRA